MNHLERTRRLDFHEYALLRDMLSFATDVQRSAHRGVSAGAALDIAHGLRRGQRPLATVAGETPGTAPETSEG